MSEDSHEWPWPLQWVLGFKEITAPTNRRTVIASLFPRAAFGNKSPIFLPAIGDPEETAAAYKDCACPASRQSQQHRFGLRGSSESAWTNAEPLPPRTVPPHSRPTSIPPSLRRPHRPTTSSATTSSASPTPPTTWPPSPRDLGHDGPALPLGPRSPPPPPSPPRRPLLPPLRPRPGRRRTTSSPPSPSSNARTKPQFGPLPHQSPNPRLHERPSRRRHRIHRSAPQKMSAFQAIHSLITTTMHTYLFRTSTPMLSSATEL